MIIFDLDGTLANCEHRRHFVDPRKRECLCGSQLNSLCHKCKDWQPNWPAFYEACNLDEPIEPVLSTFIHLTQGEPFNHDVQIWSGRCESVREKTLKWLVGLTGYCEDYQYWDRRLKMRPIGDNTPDEVLKERWLDESCLTVNELSGRITQHQHSIDFVFDDRPKVVRMWRRRGVFVFDCNQTGVEF
jgi:hypothetical protein